MTTKTEGIQLSHNQLLGFAFAALVGFMTFKDDIFKGDQSQTIAITQLTLQIENLSNSVKRLEDFSRAPRFTQESFNFEMRERDSITSILSQDIVELEEDLEELQDHDRVHTADTVELDRRLTYLEKKYEIGIE